MNPEAKKLLDEILEKSIESLTPDDIGFLRARVSYLKKNQLEEYKEVLTVKEDKKK